MPLPHPRPLLAAALALSAGPVLAAVTAQGWLTTADRQNLLAPQADVVAQAPEDMTGHGPFVVVDGGLQYQTIDGFGFALTGGSAQNLMKMTAAARAALLRELFTTEDEGIGVSYLRVSIGASDLNDHVFSYDDLPPGREDPRLEHFDLAEDKVDVIPVLREILALQPRIKILGSPWSAPAWMKTNQEVQGGQLKVFCYPVYAAYFVKYLQAMAAAGIPIDAITVQNEPFNDGNTPSMQMFAKQEAAFIRDHLGPALRRAGLRTRIILYDHNCDAPQYPVSILTDRAARAFVDGSAFHLYAGPISALSVVHDRFPDKGIYFTEQAVGEQRGFKIAGAVARVVIGATRNWSRNVLLWNLANDPQFRPHTDHGGCTSCQGAVTLDGDRVSRKLAYYVIAHASRFVPPGSVRLGSRDLTPGVASVAFLTPGGRTVAILANTGEAAVHPELVDGDDLFRIDLPAGAVATYAWTSPPR